MKYLATPDLWDRLAAKLSNPATWPLGLDTETYGQPEKTSPQHRARIQCWSLGILTTARSPRGYHRAQGVVLPADALGHAGLRRLLEDPGVPKWAHNAPHDYHSLWNSGVSAQGLRDTLQWSRVAMPDLWFGYGLKKLEVHVLGKPERPDFREVTRLAYRATRARRKAERGCLCGRKPCRARASSDWLDGDTWRPHERVGWTRFTPETVDLVRQRDVSEMVPGCEGWDTWVDYALADAVGVLELWDYLRFHHPDMEVEYPWA